MGKVGSGLAIAAILVSAVLAPWQPTSIRAQTAPAISCSGGPLASPMQGHYTGPWHSDGDYHFAVHFPAFGGYPASDRDLEMKIIIDGTLDLTVGPDGKASGTGTGNVNAPIYHDGQQDISSGVGTISGNVTGVFSSSGSLLVLSHPTIDMHWGTFGGHAVETFPVMPDYQLTAAAFDCVTAHGSVSGQGFPDMNITDDSTGQLTRAPGVGTATGTWQLEGDEAPKYKQLSQQVDSFIGEANALLNSGTAALTPSAVQQRIVQPLQSLEATIRKDPDVARCLLDRLGAWEASVIPGLFQRASSLASAPDLGSLRQAADLLRSARLLNADCSIADNGADDAVRNGEKTALDRAIAARDWPATALVMREILLAQGDAGRSSLQEEVNHDLHALLQGTVDGPSRLDVERIAYAVGDDGDAAPATTLLRQLRPPATSTPWHLVPGPNKHPKQKPKKKRKPKKRKAAAKPTPKPTATPSPTPTSTPVPQSLVQTLSAGAVPIKAQSSGGSEPVFSWQLVSGATRYVVVVTSNRTPAILWSWSGSATSVTYGDTAIEGVGNTQNDGWSISLDGIGYTWSVLAKDGAGRIIGLRLR